MVFQVLCDKKNLKMNILIFEKSKQIEERLIDLICETVEDITFYNAGSYAEALYFLNECKPDIAVVDLEYPGNLGVELLKTITKSNAEIKVIALSSEVSESCLKQFEPYGADFIFNRYADFEQIPGVVAAIGRKINNYSAETKI